MAKDLEFDHKIARPSRFSAFALLTSYNLIDRLDNPKEIPADPVRFVMECRAARDWASSAMRVGRMDERMNTDHVSPSSREELGKAVETLQAHKDGWVTLSILNRISLIDELIRDYASVIPHLVKAEVDAKGFQECDFSIAQEWLAASVVLRNLRSLKRALVDIQTVGHPKSPGAIVLRPDGQVVVQVFPETCYDRLLSSNHKMDVWMEPGVTLADLPRSQALSYHDKNHPGKVALVLGGGDFSAIGFTDVLFKLFVEDRVVLLKMNPVNAYAGPILEEGFRSLVKPGFLRLAYGGPVEGAILCNHPGVDEIHITGSTKTFEAIVFGPGDEGLQRKAKREPLLTKPITGELGNITPVIIVPGPWIGNETDHQAEKLVSWLITNAGFTCNTPHLLLMHAEWSQRQQLLDVIRQKLSRIPLQKAYYPGAHKIHQAFVSAHPEAQQFGQPREEELPWTLISSVAAERTDDICFRQEAFCGLLAETPIHAASVPEFLDRAVDFANQTVWGTLAAALFVHPASLRVSEIASAVDRALANLRYGTISVNAQAGLAWALAVSPWGGFPGQDIYDAQSGVGWVHNTLMFSHPQKVVLHAPFMESPRSLALVSRGSAYRRLAPKLVALEAAPSPWKIPGIVRTAVGW
ncbi:MAG: aldehyde dehydrogenase [Coprothermobacterota bacterium]|nr:aldehyde dehydrogenase [Coprothermobacterota bacterium]